MDEQQEAARRFIDELCRITGWSLSRLAKEAGISHTTLTRFANNLAVTHTLTARTLGKLKRAVRSKISAEQFDMMWLMAQRPPIRA